jgi:hypothetical protein
MPTTIVLDTYVWVLFSKDKNRFFEFCEWVLKNDVWVVVHSFTLLELFKTIYDNEANVRIINILNTPNIFFLMDSPIGFRYREFEQEFFHRTPFTREDIRQQWVSEPTYAQWNVLFNTHLIEAKGLREIESMYKNASAFTKMTAKFSKESSKHKVKHFLAASDFNVRKDQYVYYEENFKKYLGKGFDLSQYEKFQSDSIKKIVSTNSSALKMMMIDTIRDFNLDPEIALEMDLQEFGRRQFYLRLLLLACEHCDNLKNFKTKFIEEMKWKQIDRFPGFCLAKRVEDKIDKSEAKAKSSNKFDVFSLTIAPYVDFYIADSAIVEACKQVGLGQNVLNREKFFGIMGGKL